MFRDSLAAGRVVPQPIADDPMKKILLLPVALGLAVMAASRTPLAPLGVGVGSPLPAVELEDFAQTEATSFDDFVGRAVLIEFFAYW